ncbi:MAG: hypothetical protein E7367_00800 [Clostridiales bacterium]|nr:hypothetical protein [Clostridiales bacterium]
MKNKTIRTIYGVAFLAYTALVGVLSVLKALNLHLGGGYTKDGVETALTELLPFLLGFAAWVVVGVIVYAIFPVEQEKLRVKPNTATQIAKFAQRLPEGAWSEGKRALKKKTLLLWGITGGVLAVLFFFPLCYLLNGKNFNYTDTNTEMVQAAAHTLPFVAVAFAVVIVAYLMYTFMLKKALAEVKALTAQAAKDGTMVKGGVAGVKEGWLDDPKKLWIVRGILIALALVLTIFGIVNGGMNEVFKKAAELCTECVGLA